MATVLAYTTTGPGFTSRLGHLSPVGYMINILGIHHMVMNSEAPFMTSGQEMDRDYLMPIVLIKNSGIIWPENHQKTAQNNATSLRECSNL